jgi:CHAT domain-containing protein/tetratricopeptide (TPR) repeat protein
MARQKMEVYKMSNYPAPDESRFEVQAQSANKMLESYLTSGHMPDLDAAIAQFQAALPKLSPEDPNSPGFLGNLGLALFTRYQHTDRLPDLEGAIGFLEKALGDAPENDPVRFSLLSSLGNCLHERFFHTKDVNDLDASIDAHRQAIAGTPLDSPDRPGFLTNLANSLRVRYSQVQNPADLEEAIQNAEAAVNTAPADSPRRARFLTNLAECLRYRYQLTNQLDDLDRALPLAREAVALTSVSDRLLALRLNNLASILIDRYQSVGQLSDLAEAVEIRRQAVTHTDAAAAFFSDRLVSLARGLYLYFEDTKDEQAFQETIATYQRAQQYCVEGSATWLVTLDGITQCLETRYSQTGELANLESAIEKYRQALKHIPIDSPEWVRFTKNCASNLWRHSLHTGQLDDLSEAIHLGKQIIEKTPSHLPYYPAQCMNLGGYLFCRYVRINSLEDLEDALNYSEEAILHISLSASERSQYQTFLANYWNAYLTRTEAPLHPIGDKETKMAHSRALSHDFTCNVCNQTFAAEIWTFIDTQERPDLLTRVQNASLYCAICPRCGAYLRFDVTVGLLLYFSNRDIPFLFSPARDEAASEIQSQLKASVRIACEAFGDVWQDNWVRSGVSLVKRDKLPTSPAVSPGFSEKLDILLSMHRALQNGDIPENRANSDTITELCRWLIKHPALTTISMDVLPNIYNVIAYRLDRQYQSTGQRGDLSDAISVFRRALTGCSEDWEYLDLCLMDCSTALRERYSLDSNLSDLDETIRMEWLAISLAQPRSAKPEYLDDLSGDLRERHARTGLIHDLNEAIEAAHQAVMNAAEKDPNRAIYLNNLGIGLMTRYDRQSSQDDLNEAIVLYQQAIACTPENAPQLPNHLANLGNGLLSRYKLTRNQADLEEAIQYYQNGLALAAPESEYWAACLERSGAGLFQLYLHTMQPTDWETAAAALHKALAAIPIHSSMYPICLNNLGNLFFARYQHTRQQSDLEDAIVFLEQALEQTPVDSLQLSLYEMLGRCLKARYEYRHDLVDLQKATQYIELSVMRRLDGGDCQPSLLAELSKLLLERGQHTGLLSDLDKAIDFAHQALQATSEDADDWVDYSGYLASCLIERYGVTGSVADLEDALRLAQHAAGKLADSSPNRAALLATLGSCFYQRAQHIGELHDLEEAIRFYRIALAVTTADSADYFGVCANLSNSLAVLFTHTHRLSDLDEAIHLDKQAIAGGTEDRDMFSLTLIELGASLGDRHDQTKQQDDLEEAIRLTKQGIDRMPQQSIDRPMAFNYLGIHLTRRFLMTNDPKDQRAAFDAFETACQEGLELGVEQALHSATNWGKWASRYQLWEEAVRAYRYGLTSIDRLYETQLLLADRDSWLARAKEVYANAAYSLARTGRLKEALVVIEQGRTRNIRESLGYTHANAMQFIQSRPDLYIRFQQAVTRLHQLQASERQTHVQAIIRVYGETFVKRLDSAGLREQIRKARSDLEALAAEMRQAGDRTSFVSQPDIEDVVATLSSSQAIVYILTTAYGSLALVLHRTQQPPQSSTSYQIIPVWANKFTADDLDALLVKYENGQVVDGYLLGQLGQLGSVESSGDLSGGELRTTASSITRFQAAISQCVLHIGEHLMAGLATELRNLELDELAFILCGHLSLLPLHAAAQIGGEKPTILDEFTVSYTPSATPFYYSQQAVHTSSTTRTTLTSVGNPLPLREAEPLLFSSFEAAQIAQYGGDQATLLCEGDATKGAILEAIKNSNYIHFACHGLFDTTTPLGSRLLFSQDEAWTLADILELSLRNARLVSLSACQTGISDFEHVPDEVVGLPSGFLQAGVSGVVGTLWPVNDLSTALLMIKFYEAHLKNGLTPAAALRNAQLWVRDVTCKDLRDFFNQLRKNLPSIAMQKIAEEQFRAYTLRNPTERPFAHPYYWAAFAFYGA